MAIQKYPIKVWAAKPELTRAGNYKIQQVYTFIDVCREEQITYKEICNLLRVDFHRIIYFEKLRGINVGSV